MKPLGIRILRAVGELTGLGTPLRRAYRELTGQGGDMAYTAAQINRLTLDWLATLRSADAEVKASLRRLRARARDLARNDGYVRQYLALLVSNVIGPQGMRHRAQVRDAQGELRKDLNRLIEAAWLQWAEAPVTADGTLTLVELQQLLLQSAARDGEIFVRILSGFEGNPFGIALQPIDPDLLDSDYSLPAGRNQNEIRMGVEVDSFGRRLAYWFSAGYPGEGATPGRERVTAEQVIHICKPDRVNQTRGVTWLHAIMWPIKVFDGYEEAELVASRISSAKMGFLQQTDPASGDPTSPAQTASMDAAPGSIELLNPGVTFAGWDPQHPTTAFKDFVKTILRKISSGLGCLYNSLANDLEGVSYSSMRSGLLIERDGWRLIQHWWIPNFLSRIYPAWLSSALLSGALRLDSRDPRLYSAVKWRPRGWDWVDPLKDVQAAALGIANGLTSRSEVLGQKGQDFEDVLEQLAEEKELAGVYGVTLASEAPAPASPVAIEEP